MVRINPYHRSIRTAPEQPKRAWYGWYGYPPQRWRCRMIATTPNIAQMSEPQLYQVTDVMRMLRLSRTVVYELIRSGRLRSVKEGRARRVTAAAIRDYIALLEREAEEAA